MHVQNGSACQAKSRAQEPAATQLPVRAASKAPRLMAMAAVLGIAEGMHTVVIG